MESISESPFAIPFRWKVSALLVSVVLMVSAFPPLDFGFLAWFALAPIFAVIVSEPRPRKAFKWAYVFGILHWGATVIWISSTVNMWTHSNAGWFAWVALTLLKSLWFGLFGVVGWWAYRKSQYWMRPVALGCAWCAAEWLRCQTAVAMPWSLIGYTQYRYLSVIQISDITGVFGVSFLIASFNGALAGPIITRLTKNV